MRPTADQLFEAVDATWPAARMMERDPWVLREGKGGGKRVSAATASRPVDADEITDAEQGMEALGQIPLFMLRADDTGLDAALDARGYRIVDPVTVMICPIGALTDRPVPRLAAFTIWEPLAIMEEIWAQGGIGPARIAVMRRAACKTAVFARQDQKPAGVGFAAVHKTVALVHAVEVLPEHRRQGVAGWIMRQSAFWAAEQGATEMAVLCTKANTNALRLYSGLGFEPVSQYHYRQAPDNGDLRNG